MAVIIVSSGIVVENGSRTVSSGEIYLDTTVNSGGSFFVQSGGVASDTTVNTGGCVYVPGGGTANGILVNEEGCLCVSSGGTATIIFNPWQGIIDSDDDAIITYLERDAKIYYGSSGGLVSKANIMESQNVESGYSAIVYSDGIANSTTVVSDGLLTVSDGGTANDTIVNEYGNMYVFSGAVANHAVFNSQGNLTVSSGGIANDITVNYEGKVKVFSAAGINRAIVNSGGYLTIFSSAMADDTTIASGGRLFVESDGKLTGRMMFESGAIVSVYSGAVFDLDLTQTEAGAAALVNDLSFISGTPLYTLTVSGTEADGIYILAEGADGFNRTISVLNPYGALFGMLTVGETITINKVDYALNLNDGTLSVTVGDPVPPPPDWTFFNGDFNGDGADMLAVQSGSTVTVYMNGEPWGLGVALDPGWSVVGNGDFSGDGLDDFLRVNTEGYVVGEMSNGNGTFSPQVLNFLNAGWEILGTGDFNGNGSDDVLIANPTGASETVGLLGYWESGVTWTLINGYSPEWECVSTGDFNGDGKCDMLWRNSFEGEGGLIYNAYCTWIMDDPVDWRMVSVANPDEWDFLCSGDFDGDKTNDIAMINDVGVVGIWGVDDGYLSSWSILSAVNPAEWQFSGVADFNGDGTDDIAWSNTTTGQAGCWQIENKELASWQILATLS